MDVTPADPEDFRTGPSGEPGGETRPVAAGEEATAGLSAGTRFRILGALEVWRDGSRRTLGGQRQERVLATLLLHPGQSVPLTRLVEAVWGPEPPATARHQVRKIMGELRHLLGSDLIVTDGAGYRIDLLPKQLDLLEFQAHLKAARDGPDPPGHLREALRLWRGPALSGVDGPVIAAAALMLNESRVDALERLADISLTTDEAAALLPDLQNLLGDHPLRETLRGRLMTALYRCGRQSEALAVFQEGRHLLRDELGVDPSPRLARLHEQLLRNDPSLLADPPLRADRPEVDAHGDPMGQAPLAVATLPYDISDFTGRRIEMSALLTIVPEAAQQALTIVTIDGMAGVGKSALAIHAAHRLAKRFPDGQLFIDLHGFTAGRSPVEPVEAGAMGKLTTSSKQTDDQLATITAKSLAIIGDEEMPAFLSNAKRLNDTIPGCGLKPITGAGHLVLIEEPAQVAPILDEHLR